MEVTPERALDQLLSKIEVIYEHFIMWGVPVKREPAKIYFEYPRISTFTISKKL